jgi:HK97 gp10 family phage protein
MDVKGEAELLLNLDKLTKGYDRRARKAVRDGANVFVNGLKQNTPVGENDRPHTHLTDDIKHSNVSIATGQYSVDVGYGKEEGPIAHFPNSGTSKQDPQHFIEKTQAQERDAVLMEFIKNLKL